MINNGYGRDGGNWNGNMPVGQNTGYLSNVTQYGTYSTPPYGSNPSSNNVYINDGSNWERDSPVKSVLYPSEAELKCSGSYAGCNDNADNATHHTTNRNVDNNISYGQSVNFNNGYVTGFKTYDEFETEEYIHMYFEEEQVWKRLSKKTTEKQEAGFDGKAKIRTEIKAKGIPICESIFFINAYKFNREDMPKKDYYCVNYKTKSNSDITVDVFEKSEIESNKFCLKIFPEGVKVGRETECSQFYRSIVYRLASNNQKIVIPDKPGWEQNSSGWKFLNCASYIDLGKNNLPLAISRRFVGKTDRSVPEVLTQLKQILASNEKLTSLLMLKMAAPLQLLHERHGNSSHIMPFVKIGNTRQIDVASAILKDSGLEAYNIIPLDSYRGDIIKEIKACQDGIPVFLGPLKAAEAKSNNKQVREARNAAIGAVTGASVARCLISIIGRFVPAAVSEELIFNIDCTDIPVNIDLKMLRSLSLKLIAALIEYIEKNFNKVEGIVKRTIDSYKSEPDTVIPFQYQGLYIMFLSVRALVRECFGTEFISNDLFEKIKILFTKAEAESSAPDYIVRDHFLDVTYNLICTRKIIIMELKDAHKNYQGEDNFLILDRKKGFLNFSKAALDMIAQMIPTVKDGDELGAILKACNSIYCTDNGARQITISGRRPEFYSVYLSEFGDDILQIIRYIDNIEFFMLPEEVPENFIPLVWFRGRCAGIVLDGIGLPNPHINICGMSGMGKNRGAYRNGECFLRLRSKFIFINIKGPITEDSLNDMGCPTDKYDLFDLKTEGLPFDIFNVSGFKGKNAKVSYILNIICAAVNDLTDNQLNELSDYINNMVGDDTQSFSLLELFEKFPKNRTIALQKKLTPLFNMMSAYTPKDENYKYSSCREFIDDCGRITVLSIVQSNITALRCTVYALLQSIFEHQILDSHTRLVLYADEMQKYTADSPFQQWFAEGRQFNIIAAGMTQEYRSRDNETRNFTSNAAMELFYPPTSVSANEVFKALNKGFSIEELCSGNLGDIIGKGFFWSTVEKRHKYAIICGKNDDDNFSKLKIRPKGYYGNVL